MTTTEPLPSNAPVECGAVYEFTSPPEASHVSLARSTDLRVPTCADATDCGMGASTLVHATVDGREVGVAVCGRFHATERTAENLRRAASALAARDHDPERDGGEVVTDGGHDLDAPEFGAREAVLASRHTENTVSMPPDVLPDAEVEATAAPAADTVRAGSGGTGAAVRKSHDDDADVLVTFDRDHAVRAWFRGPSGAAGYLVAEHGFTPPGPGRGDTPKGRTAQVYLT